MTQDRALDILKTGANVFLTGEPGSGKTHTINTYIQYLQERGVEPSVTASTGIAATHVSGMTIHSWSGVGVRSTLSPYELEQLMEKERLVKRLGQAHVLIIDEISMLSRETLDTVETVCRTLRRRTEPWGGLQVIFVGDFFQLPPIERQAASSRSHTDDLFSIDLDSGHGSTHGEQRTDTHFAYNARAWKAAQPLVCYLSEQHRQEGDELLSILGALRGGSVEEMHRDALTARMVPPPDTIVTQLYPKNENVDRINATELARIKGVSRAHNMTTTGFQPIVEGLKKSCLSPEVLELKVGARVMFTRNAPDTSYVNGTLGEVVNFARTTGFPVVRTYGGSTLEVVPVDWTIEDQGRVVASLTQIPLRLAWAITVHKSQGMSLDAAIIDLRNAFEYGQGYVALSRVRSLEGLYLHGFNQRALLVHPDVLEHDNSFHTLSLHAEEAFEGMDPDERLKLQKAYLIHIGAREVPRSRDEVSTRRGQRNREVKRSTFEETKDLVTQGMSLADVARERKVTIGTVVTHLERLVKERALHPERELLHLKPTEDNFTKMSAALRKHKTEEGIFPLSPARTTLQDRYSFEDLRLARLFL
jgi:ATP-dependent DNA helicase PIF1